MATPLSSMLIATGLEAALNRLLQLDPEAQSRLAELADAVIAIDLDGLGLSVYLQAAANGVRVLSGYDGEPTVRIGGTPLALARHWRGDKSAGNALTMTGDAAVARQFQTLLTQLDIDWEEQLSRKIGDVAAYQLGRFWRGFRAWSRQSADALLRDSSEYVQYELQALPPRPAVEQFLSAIDTLREDADRLAARIVRLRRLAQSGDSI